MRKKNTIETRLPWALALVCASISPAAAGESPTTGLPGSTAQVAPALAFAPLVASSLIPGTRVTLVASRSATAQARAVHALIERPGTLVSWIELPLSELPEAAFVVNQERIVCLLPRPGGDAELIALDYDGRRVASMGLLGLLPEGAQRTGERVSLCATVNGACLTVPLACGTLAIVEMEPLSAASPGADALHSAPFRVCSVILSDKHACGVDAWLTQARQLDRDGDKAAAKFALEAAIETDPADARGYRELAQFHRRGGAVQDQILCLQTGVETLHAEADGVADDDWQVGTPAARLTLDLVVAAQGSKDVQLASDSLRMALGLYPCMEQIVLLRAEVLLEEAEPEVAVAFLRDALAQLDPNADLAAATHDVGRFLRRHGQFQDALPFLEDAYALGDHSEFLLRGLADVSQELGRPERAAEWLTFLAKRWRSAKNGESGESRSQRAQERLRELDEEIVELLSLAATLSD